VGRARARLRERVDECALLDRLVRDVRGGEGRSLVLRGEAGIGKTALLEFVVDSASDLTIIRAVGVETEMELAFASLQQLCRRLTDARVAHPAASDRPAPSDRGHGTGGVTGAPRVRARRPSAWRRRRCSMAATGVDRLAQST
jgi:hypothetical protein